MTQLHDVQAGQAGRSRLGRPASRRCSGFWRRPLRAFRLLEETLGRLGAGRCIWLSACLLWPSSLALPLALVLALPLTLASPLFRRASWSAADALNAVARCQTDFEFDNLVPNGVGALMVWNRQKFAQTTPRVGRRRFASCGLGSGLRLGRAHGRWLFVVRGLAARRFDGLFFAHRYIIARIMSCNPVLQVASTALWFFCHAATLPRVTPME